MDVVVPVGPNDIFIANECVSRIKKHVKNAGRIYIISNSEIYFPLSMDVECILESRFPFSITQVREIITPEGKERAGWYFQQLLKLYVCTIVPELSEKYLVVDADTLFMRDIEFVDNNGRALYAWGSEYHPPYFEHMQRMHTSLTRVADRSGICHHMVFCRERIQSLFSLMGGGHEFWQRFLTSVAKKDRGGSGASEYEMYFNFMLKFYPREIALRELKWANMSVFPSSNQEFDFVSLHYHMRI